VSWMPAFEIGFWNAWILMLFVVLHPLIMKFVDKAVGTGMINQKMGDVPNEGGEKRHISLPTALLVVIFVYSIFLPLQFGSAWFYIGFVLYLAGTLIFLNAIMTAAKTPLGKVFTQGMYRYSRHPLYVSFLFVLVGISVACASWLFLLLSFSWMIFPFSQVNAEEQVCIKSFGIEYQEYMKRTPKWLWIPKTS
jgi:protein-S-isoprenylcysteine O-methyltransferase Ste14